VKKYAVMTGALAAAAALVGGALAGTASRTVAFTASYAGTASVKVTGSTAVIAAQGAGRGTLVGASRIVGKGTGDTSAQPCALWKGTGTITGTGGKIYYAVVTGAKACPNSDQTAATVAGKATVKGGTGKYLKARGTLKFTGNYNKTKGTFRVKFTGSLTV
jgi:hypothetical protein